MRILGNKRDPHTGTIPSDSVFDDILHKNTFLLPSTLLDALVCPSMLSFWPRLCHAILPAIMLSCHYYVHPDHDFPQPCLHLETS